MRFCLNITYHPLTDRKSERTIHTLEDMLRVFVIEYDGSLDTHSPLVEFSYNNTYLSRIDIAPYEILYGRKCHTPTCSLDPGEKQFVSSKIVQIIEDNMKITHARLRMACERQNKYPN